MAKNEQFWRKKLSVLKCNNVKISNIWKFGHWNKDKFSFINMTFLISHLWKLYLSKIDPIFVNVALLHFKIIETLLNLLLNFVSPTLKLHNQYCPSSKRVKNLSLHWVTFCVICLWKILGTLFNLVSVRLWDFKDGGS